MIVEPTVHSRGDGPNLRVCQGQSSNFPGIPTIVFKKKLYSQTNIEELWKESGPGLAEMTIEIWVSVNQEKLFETSSVRWILQPSGSNHCVLGDTSISEHLKKWKRKETCIEYKETWYFEYLVVILESRTWITVKSKIISHENLRSSVPPPIWSQHSLPHRVSIRWVVL